MSRFQKVRTIPRVHYVALRVIVAAILVSSAFDAAATTSGVLGLDGSSRISVTNAPDLNPTEGITIEAWIRPTSFSGYPTIVGKDYQNGYWLGLTPSGQVRYYANGSSSITDGIRALPLSQWTHVAVTFDGTTRRIYVDGALDREHYSPSALPITADDLAIGSEFDGSFPFTGNIAEVRFWDHARRQIDIRDDLVRQMDASRTGLIAVFSLDGSAEEILGRFETTEVGNPIFAGAIPAPPVRSGPWLIPRLAAAPALDGVCSPSEWGFFRVPLYYDATSPPSWVRMGSTLFSFHVCFDRISRSSVVFPSEAKIAIDSAGDQSFFPDAGDRRLTVTETNDFLLDRGADEGAGWIDFGPSTFYDGVTDTSTEFTFSAEFRISTLSLSPPFGLALFHDNFAGLGDITEWPEGSNELFPGTWDQATFDSNSLPPSDAAAPRVLWGPLPREIGGYSPAGRTIRISPQAFDDVDLVEVRIYVDGVLVETCPLPGPDDVEAMCVHEDVYSLGRHYWRASATDHVGRIGETPAAVFFAGLDGAAPDLLVAHTPSEPSSGETVTIAVDATDDEGISEIRILATALPFARTCTFPSGQTAAHCEMEIPGPSARTWYRYRAEVVDTEGRVDRTGSRYVVYDMTTADDDGDGLPTSLENGICTNPFDIDSDRDGLSDKVEIMGFDSPTGGFVDLPGLGADPCHRDVFLQFDYETGADVETGVLSDIISAYRNNGITLHVDKNERPRPTSSPTSPLGSTSAAFQRTDGRYWFAPERNYTHHYAYSHHKVGRSGAWKRYFTFQIYVRGDSCSCPLSEMDPQRNCNASMGCVRETRSGQAARFMHELGHTAGLGHGGQTGSIASPTVVGDYLFYDDIRWQNTNYKPNHRSLMNYLYNGGDYCVDPGATEGSRPSVVKTLSYSTGALPALHESNLDEDLFSPYVSALRMSSCSAATDDFEPAVRFTCFDDRFAASGTDTEARVSALNDGTRIVARRVYGSSWSFPDAADEPLGIDWNCDGSAGSVVSQNVNGNGGDYHLPGEICNGINDNPTVNNDVDEGCNWSYDSEMFTTMNEWDRIPRPPSCLHLYKTRDGADCYAQTLAYREAIGSVGTVLDCRLTAGFDFEDRTCSDLPMEFSGFPIDEEIDTAEAMDLENVEFCNDFDDDLDGEIDEGCRDADLDGIADAVDLCPATPDPDQFDANSDGIGDACDRPTPPDVVTVVEHQNGNDVSWDASIGEVSGYRVYRVRPWDGTTLHVVDTGQTFVFDEPKTLGPWIYQVFPLDLNGGENLELVTEGTPVPEPGLVVALVAGCLLLVGLAMRRDRVPLERIVASLP